jgi:hypothetical protein
MWRKRTGKYNAKKVSASDGTLCASKRERNRYEELLLLARAGAIKDLKIQVPFELVPKQRNADGKAIRKVEYVADFVYTDTETGRQIVEDTKGMKTREYVIKAKLMLWRYGITVREV